ncbi:putative retrotransposon gag domain-containing protein [Helianthus annuus]|nr:putative retrotransposon gag domain-containing protein [Helianthus annuus]
MTGQGIIPEFGFGTNSNTALGEGIQNFQAQQIEKIGEVEINNTGGPRESFTRITQVVTPGNGEGPSNTAPPQNVSALLGLPEGETPASWYAKNIATINAAYQSLIAQQAVLTAEPSLVTPQSQGVRQRPPPANIQGRTNRPPPTRRFSIQDTRDTRGETDSYYEYPSNLQRGPVHSRLTPRNMNNEWEETDPYYPTWEGDEESSVFNRLPKNHEYYKPRQHIGYTEEAERDFRLAYRPAEAAEHSKFIPKIALAPLSREKLPPTVGKFNGLTDPNDHVRTFTSVGCMGGWNMPMWCHLFIQTLTGAARAWFDSLPPGKIKSWTDFKTQFLSYFSQQRRYQRDTAEVEDIWRRDGEGLEDFITRFNKECLEIGGVSEQLMRCHFKKAIRCDSLIRTITGKDGMPKEWDKLMEAAKIVAQTEESLAGGKGYYPEDRFSRGSTRDNNNKRNKYKSHDWKSERPRGRDV